MYSYSYTRHARAPAGVCFAVVSDPDLGARWISAAHEVEAVGPPGVGRILRSKVGLVGVNFTLESQVHRYEEPTAYGWSGDRPFHTAFDFAFTPADDGTDIGATVEVDPARFFKFGTGRIAAQTFARQFEGDLDRLVELIHERAG